MGVERREKQRGAIVVEATIALTTFMFMIVMILSIVNVCLVQAKIGTLVNGVAKDLSYYSYLYSITGIRDKEKSLHDGSAKARDTVTSLRESENVLDAVGKLSNIRFDSELWDSVKQLITDEAANGGKKLVINPICQNLAEKRLAMSTNDANMYLHKLGIKGGVKDLDFSLSEYCSGGSDKIKVVCVYKVQWLRLLNVDRDFCFCQTAETRAWGSAQTIFSAYNDSKPEDSSEEEPDEEKPKEESEEQKEDEEKPEEEDEKKPKTTEQYKKDNTHNASANQVVLGEFNNGTGSYASQGASHGMTYLSFSDEDWETLSAQGYDAEKDVIDRFMNEQEVAGKTFYLTDSPYDPRTNHYYDQVDWLINHGYEFNYDPGIGLYRAEKKQDN